MPRKKVTKRKTTVKRTSPVYQVREAIKKLPPVMPLDDKSLSIGWLGDGKLVFYHEGDPLIIFPAADTDIIYSYLKDGYGDS